ncbi:MAG: chromosome segregation protein SMC [Bacillota bacterium]|jgi:chromosome segregation protein
MFLKRLEIQGFKTFADRLDVEPVGQITAIVGPNGCGKSNIVDGIRWVLGEPNARTLRGTRMEDIIFAGSDRRKPVGMAEVSITLDNSLKILPIDYNEVRITRRVYRSGESEFLINRAPCRLRDIQNLLQDTGIGYESFSIIGQGKVDAILSSRPEERRRLVEEVAGITRHLTRKQDSLRKLEETKNALIRLEDVLEELGEQLGPLEEQAVRAKSYRKLQAELAALETKLWLREWYQLEGRHQKNRLIWEDIKQKCEDQERELQLATEQLALQRLVWQEAREELEKETEALHEAQQAAERAKLTGQMLRQKYEAYQEQEAEAKRQTLECRGVLDKLLDERVQAEKRRQQLQTRLAEQQEKLEQLTGQEANLSKSCSTKSQEIEQIKSDLIENLKLAAEKRNVITRLRIQEDNRERRAVQIRQEKQARLTRREELRKQIWGIEQTMAEQANRLLQIKQLKDELLNRDQWLSQKLIKWTEENRRREDRSRFIESRLQVLREMEQTYEGYSQAVREIMRCRQTESFGAGIRGVVAELIEFPTQYEKAIEVALGGAVQNVVTDTERIAREAIHFLKTGKHGRVTFLPLDTIRPLSLEDSRAIQSGMGILGRAVDLIKYNPIYRPVMEFLLGRVWVAESMEAAANWARQQGFTRRVVTLDGEVFNPGGSLTGGSLPDKKRHIFGRRREIKELEAASIREQEILQLQQKEMEDLKQKIQDLKKSRADLEQEQYQLELVRISGQKDLVHLKQELDKLLERLTIIDYEEKDLTEQGSGLHQEIQLLEQELSSLTQRETVTREELEIIQLTWEEERRQLKTIENNISNLREARAAGKQRLLGLEDNLSRLEREEDRLKQKLAAYQQRIQETTAQLGKLRDGLAVEASQLNAAEDRANIYQAKVISIRNHFLVQQNNVQHLEQSCQQKRLELNQLLNQKHSLEVQITKLEAEGQGWLERLWEVYQISRDQAQYLINEEATKITAFNSREARHRIKELQQEITALGEVNLGAVEEYERVSHREHYLRTQQADLRKACHGLEQIIVELDRVMAERFQTSLDKINQNFDLVFRDIFGGGKARLYLTNQDSPLDSGLEIIAQPPGKKLQPLSLLSGGERALTAIALLFGILQVKPGPLCILDEIEAALDEVNVKRFAQFLRRFAEKTQFIVISHRKGTMEVADALYGLTMEEKGVSKLISVRLVNPIEQVV